MARRDRGRAWPARVTRTRDSCNALASAAAPARHGLSAGCESRGRAGLWLAICARTNGRASCASMRFALTLACVLAAAGTARADDSARGADKGTLGVGIILGEPTGISA